LVDDTIKSVLVFDVGHGVFTQTNKSAAAMSLRIPELSEGGSAYAEPVAAVVS
jgi:hypothetical protein